MMIDILFLLSGAQVVVDFQGSGRRIRFSARGWWIE